MALEPVVGDRLPGRRVAHELPVARAHARVAVDRAEPHAARLAPACRAAEERRPTLAAEQLGPALLGIPPLHELLAGGKADAARLEGSVRRRCRAGAVLAARAVAVAGLAERGGDLEAHAAAEAAAGQMLSHGVRA